MKNNFKGHSRYHLLDKFNHFGEIDKMPYFKEDADIDEYIFKDFLKNYCNERLSKEDFYDIFGCAYVSSGGFALVTLDTNEYVFIDDEYYMSYLALDDDNMYVVCMSDKNELERYFKIC